jgi:hypothetical protein
MKLDAQAPWSLASLIDDFSQVVDVEGRPVHEGRAPAAVKEGVPMVMKRCPYPDERHGRMMNVSALAQITDHLDAVLANVAACRAGLPARPASWDVLYRALLDQLAQGAVFVLRHPGARLPAHLSVGYKVAAGYQVPVRELLELELLGRAPAPTVEHLLAYVRGRASLVGKREVCAAPMVMVARVTAAMVEGGAAPVAATPDPALVERTRVVELLMRQAWLGIVWGRLDQVCERRLLLDDPGRARLHPRTPYLARLLDERVAAVAGLDADAPLILPPVLDDDGADALREVIAGLTEGAAWGGDAAADARLPPSPDAAVELTDRGREPQFARRFAAYLRAYRVFLARHERLERALRAVLGVPTTAPVAFSPGVFPRPRALRWFEVISGYRVRAPDDAPTALTLRSQLHTIAVPA